MQLVPRVLKVVQGLQARRVPLERPLLDHRATQARKALQVRSVHKEQPAHKVLQVLLAHKGRLVLPVRKEQLLLVSQALKARQVRLARLAQQALKVVPVQQALKVVPVRPGLLGLQDHLPLAHKVRVDLKVEPGLLVL